MRQIITAIDYAALMGMMLIQRFADAGTVVNTTAGYVNANTGEAVNTGAMSVGMKTYYATEMLENARSKHYFAQFLAQAVMQRLKRHAHRHAQHGKQQIAGGDANRPQHIPGFLPHLAPDEIHHQPDHVQPHARMCQPAVLHVLPLRVLISILRVGKNDESAAVIHLARKDEEQAERGKHIQALAVFCRAGHIQAESHHKHLYIFDGAVLIAERIRQHKCTDQTHNGHYQREPCSRTKLPIKIFSDIHM